MFKDLQHSFGMTPLANDHKKGVSMQYCNIAFPPEVQRGGEQPKHHILFGAAASRKEINR